jgi:coenzyme F420 hydrogenase subunit beta
MPGFLRPIMAWVMPRFGPRGLEFAKARVEMKGIESILHLRQMAPHKIKNMVPKHVWAITDKYGLSPESTEQSKAIDSN